MQNNNLGSVLLVTAALLAVACGICAYLIPHLPWVWQITGGLAVLSLCVCAFLFRGSFSETFSKKTTRYGLNVLVMSIIVTGIAIFCNLIAKEHDWKKDFTKNQSHSLSEQSIKLIKNLKTEVMVRAFTDPRFKQEFNEVFDRYAYYNKLFKFEFVDLDKDLALVEKYKIKPGGSLIIESNSRTARIENLTGPEDPKLEEKLTNAIIQVNKGEKKKIYFLTGHGERLFSETGHEGLSDLKDILNEGRYDVKDLVLIQAGKVPPDAEIVLSVGPASDFLEPETKVLEDYIRGGGKFLLLIDPNSSAGLKPFLAKFGVEWSPKKTIVEMNPFLKYKNSPLVPLVTSYDASHDITRDMKQVTVFAFATPVGKTANAPTDLKETVLFSSSPSSWEGEFEKNGVKADPKTARKGPLPLAIALSGKSTKKEEPKKDDKTPTEAKTDDKTGEFRVIIVGDAYFVTNEWLRAASNSNLFQNMLSWLAHEEDLIAIRPKPTDSRELEITDARIKIIRVACVYLLPPFIFLAGLGMWLDRRRR
jgi:ABC-type uncharacterized transport system involved in gliding motility auxiliary subunit